MKKSSTSTLKQSFELRQAFRIESARFLPNLPLKHPCRNLHGHSFEIILRMKRKLDPKIGWVRDYHEIAQAIKPTLNLLDHQTLNSVKGLENPTSEILAYWLFTKLKKPIPELIQIIVKETPSTECRFPAL